MSSALDPVSAAIYTALNVSSVTNLAATVTDDLPASVALPAVLFEVTDRNLGAFGTGTLSEIDLRTHVFTNTPGMKDAQTIDSAIRTLLKDAALTISGWTHCGTVVWNETIPIPESEVNGVKVHEIESHYTIWAEDVNPGEPFVDTDWIQP